MNSEFDDSVRTRKWTQDFDELAGRSAPPDRVEEILRRAAFDQPDDEPVRASIWRQLRPAALALLGIAAIFGVVQLREQTPSDSPAIAGVQDPVRPQQDPVKRPPVEAPAPEQPAPEQPVIEQPAPEQRAPIQIVIETPETERGQIEKVNATIRARVEAAVVAQQLQEKLDKASQNPIALAKQKELAEQVAAVQQREQQIARLLATVRQRVATSAVPPNPLITGDYQKALEKLAAERSRLETCDDAAAARKIIDNMSRTLEQARLALWQLEKADASKVK